MSVLCRYMPSSGHAGFVGNPIPYGSDMRGRGSFEYDGEDVSNGHLCAVVSQIDVANIGMKLVRQERERNQKGQSAVCLKTSKDAEELFFLARK